MAHRILLVLLVIRVILLEAIIKAKLDNSWTAVEQVSQICMLNNLPFKMEENNNIDLAEANYGETLKIYDLLNLIS